jgi:hypothetical protein
VKSRSLIVVGFWMNWLAMMVRWEKKNSPVNGTSSIITAPLSGS